MFKLILCTLTVAYLSAAPVSADNVGVNNSTVLGDGKVAGPVGDHQCIKPGYDCDNSWECCPDLTCAAKGNPPQTGNACMDINIPDIRKLVEGFLGLKQMAKALKAGKLMHKIAGQTPCPLCPVHRAGPFTVFVPSDDAFAALPKATLAHLLDPKNIKELQAVLEYHMVPGPAAICLPADDIGCYAMLKTPVISGAAIAADLKSSPKNQTAKTLEGHNVSIEQRDGSFFVDNAKVFGANFGARNGVMHLIDHVLIPPKILSLMPVKEVVNQASVVV